MVVWSDEPWWVIQLCEFTPTKVYPKCSLEWPRYIPKSFSLLSSCLLIELFWTCGFVLQVGVDLMDKSMQMIEGLQLVARTQSSQYVLDEMNWVKDDTSLVLFAWISMIMDLTLVTVDFLEQPNGNGWCQHKILGGENTYVIHLLGTYVTILCNWLIFWQNALYLYLGRSRMCLILQETVFQDQVLKSCKFVQDSSWRSVVH